MKRQKSTIDSLEYACQGLLHALRTQRHMRWHALIGGAVIFLALWLKLTRIETLIVLCAVTLVLVAEMLNTAVEATIDLFTEEYHPLAAVAKNAAAGGVLIAAVFSVVVGYIVFVPSLESVLPSVVEQVRRSPPYLTLAALALVIAVVVLLKVLNRGGPIVQGGMPSGHTAIAFALAAAVLFLTRSHPTVAVLAVLLALLVAESRLETRIHSLLEVMAGGAIGVLLTTLLFQFLYRLG